MPRSLLLVLAVALTPSGLAPPEQTSLPRALHQIRSDARAVVFGRHLPGGGTVQVVRAEHDFRVTIGGQRVRVWVVVEPEPLGPVGF